MKSPVLRLGCSLLLSIIALQDWANAVAPSSDSDFQQFATDFCIDCHSGPSAEAGLRFDPSEESYLDDPDRLESIIRLVQAERMPPADSRQPTAELRRAAVEKIKQRLAVQLEPIQLKRLTREEYTNSINDRLHTNFDLSELLPPDRPGEGFSKWGEAQAMSPHQVACYLATAQFVAKNTILDERPVQNSWEFDIRNFRGTGRGDFQTETAHALTTHYPWRSVLYFIQPDQGNQIFHTPAFGRYWIQADVTVHHSTESETISLSAGDPRYPTNLKKVARAVLPHDGQSIFIEHTFDAGTPLSFTYDSAAKWNIGNNHAAYKGRQVRFTRVRITGPISEQWPTKPMRRIFDGDRFASLTDQNARAFTEHVVSMLFDHQLPEEALRDFEHLVMDRIRASNSSTSAARALLTAILSSPYYIYKHESAVLDQLQVAQRLSYFLWNSAPDDQLLEAASAGQLKTTEGLRAQVERLLNDARSQRFCADFTREWLDTDRIDDIGPDDRVHNQKRVTFLRIRELAKEPQAFFQEILENDLSMINFIDSDFAMVNDETSRFYNFPGVSGRSFRPVKLPAESERGGLIGQAGLLKLTSTKHATSPILRGSWILKRIYGQRLTPPPNISFEEPDIRDAKTVKEVIASHQSTPSCSRCHARMDPFGLALEHYDEMGLWRKEYQHVETLSLENDKKSVKRRAAPIDSNSTLSDGRSISSMTELKEVMLADREEILKSILGKLSSYALGRQLSILDQPMVDEIYSSVSESNYSLRVAIHAIVQHEQFGRN